MRLLDIDSDANVSVKEHGFDVHLFNLEVVAAAIAKRSLQLIAEARSSKPLTTHQELYRMISPLGPLVLITPFPSEYSSVVWAADNVPSITFFNRVY